MRSWRALLLVVLTVMGCGSKTGLRLLAVVSDDDETPGAGGAAGGGGSASSAGTTKGGVAGKANAGAAGTFGSSATGGQASGGVAGTDSGGAAGSEQSAGAAGEQNGGAAGEQGGSGGEPGAPPLAVEVALGAFHTCARFDDGSSRCWGSGGFIGAGNNATIGDDETPGSAGDVSMGGPVKQLAASWYHSCALLESGKLRCFGGGGRGALGYANTASIGDDETPASAGDVNVGGLVSQVAVGPFHTCALLAAGKVRCWGSNEDWQLGSPDPETIGDDEHPASAGFVDVGGKVVQLAVGYLHTCVLLESGKVRCWGDDIGGSLGYGKSETVGDDESPADAGDVDVGGTALQLVAGLRHTCARLEGGKVRCWGVAYEGALGYGNQENIGDDETPASAGDVDVGGNVLELTAGDYSTCALLEGGKVRCWGWGQHGELGQASTESIGDDETPASVDPIALGAPALHIDGGFLHVCAIVSGGSVRCWGRGSSGALGYGNLDDVGDDETPASVGDVKTH